MKTFQITFLKTVVKRVAAPDHDAFVMFLRRFLSTSNHEIIELQDYDGDLDAIVDEKGKPQFEEHIEWWEKQIDCLANPPKNIYQGVRKKNKAQVLMNGRKFDPKPSQKVYNHSPDGFEWSYGGSGPAQLALAMLLEETGDPTLSLRLHQPFKRQVVTLMPAQWALHSIFIRNWIKENNHA